VGNQHKPEQGLLSLTAQRAACETPSLPFLLGVVAFRPKFYGNGSPAKMLTVL